MNKDLDKRVLGRINLWWGEPKTDLERYKSLVKYYKTMGFQDYLMDAKETYRNLMEKKEDEN